MPMICSSVKRLRFILWSSQWARAYFKMDYFNGARSASLDQKISQKTTCLGTLESHLFLPGGITDAI
ncbi:hypothetical protein ASC97_31660 [Rhizobium sp. Root1203]|nr:hypothetical protein ASC97_31660 [Rhizobium sp. Root1203]